MTWTVDAQRLDAERSRIVAMLSRYLIPMLRKEMKILSVGCGMGTDVLELRRLGYEAWGFDPERLSPERLREAPDVLRSGTATSIPFGPRRFDFVYALDVIEHVGCAGFKTELNQQWMEERTQFLAACFGMLKPEGVLLLTTSNRFCPIDVGHWHGYHWLGRLLGDHQKFGLSIPWSKDNFLPSFHQIRALLSEATDASRFDIACVAAAGYPTLAGPRRLVAPLLRAVDHPRLRGSVLAPILVVKITRRSEQNLRLTTEASRIGCASPSVSNGIHADS